MMAVAGMPIPRERPIAEPQSLEQTLPGDGVIEQCESLIVTVMGGAQPVDTGWVVTSDFPVSVVG